MVMLSTDEMVESNEKRSNPIEAIIVHTVTAHRGCESDRFIDRVWTDTVRNEGEGHWSHITL